MKPLLLGTFLFGYGIFRIFIDFFREYRMDLFGLPPGQEFNIGMSIAGVALVIWSIKRPQGTILYFFLSSERLGAVSVAAR